MLTEKLKKTSLSSNKKHLINYERCAYSKLRVTMFCWQVFDTIHKCNISVRLEVSQRKCKVTHWIVYIKKHRNKRMIQSSTQFYTTNKQRFSMQYLMDYRAITTMKILSQRKNNGIMFLPENSADIYLSSVNSRYIEDSDV